MKKIKTPSYKQLQYIIDNLDFDAQNHLHLKQGKMIYEFEDSELTTGLTNIIYSEFYCEGTAPEVKPLVVIKDPSPPSHAEQRRFFSNLKAANNSKESLDRGWKVSDVLPNGSLYVNKGNYHRQVGPGDYIREDMGAAMAPGIEIGIFKRRAYTDDNDIFYHVFGETLGETNTPWLVRYYFNVKSEGGIALIKNLTTDFNKFQIPFQFKCLKQPQDYNRADAAVLYLSQNYSNFAMEIFARFYPQIKPHLKSGIPYFAKRIASGISFAENPINNKESFGMSRARIIAEGIKQIYDQKLPKEKWLETVLATIRQYNLDPDHLYLNAFSNYPYRFAIK